MSGLRPFVVTVASEKGGVGKTTLATNLAVYLKALREELPVTILSFDNHFSVDNMFAIGRQRGVSVAGLFRGQPLDELIQLGEYGVQYLASERLLSSPEDDPALLRSVLHHSRTGGILIIDTRPIIDFFTHSALFAADLLLVPVRDRASLVNAAGVLETFVAGGNDPETAWLVPSIIDARLRLRADIGVREFLTFSARERGYQVLDTFISKSPKVESLATSMSSRVYPVLTHARQTTVHQQFRDIAEFVLNMYGQRHRLLAEPEPAADIPAGRLRLLRRECPVCGEPLTGSVHYFHDQRSRRGGGVHPLCLSGLLERSDAEDFLDPSGALLLFDLGDAGLNGPADEVMLRLFDAEHTELRSRACPLASNVELEDFLRATCTRSSAEFFCDRICVTPTALPLTTHLQNGAYQRFGTLRKAVIRHLSGRGELDDAPFLKIVDEEF